MAAIVVHCACTSVTSVVLIPPEIRYSLINVLTKKKKKMKRYAGKFSSELLPSQLCENGITNMPALLV